MKDNVLDNDEGGGDVSNGASFAKKCEPQAYPDVSKDIMPQTGSDLMIRFVQGDDQSFEELLYMYENNVLNFFYRLTGKRHTAEDMTQELFLKVFNYRDSYTVQASFKPFLFRIARNMWIDRYRKKKVRPREISIEGKLSSTGEEYLGIKDKTENGSASPVHSADQKEQLKKLQTSIKKLPGKQQEVLALCLEGGLKYAEISGILQIPVGTIKSRMHSAVIRLKELMGES